SGGTALPDPVERRGCRVVDGELEPRRGYCASPACHRETTQSCGGQRFHNVTNRVHLTCTPGSVGAPGSNPWSDPAPRTKSDPRGRDPRGRGKESPPENVASVVTFTNGTRIRSNVLWINELRFTLLQRSSIDVRI